jgi:hypothetical protein
MVEGQECRGVYSPEKDGSVCRNTYALEDRPTQTPEVTDRVVRVVKVVREVLGVEEFRGRRQVQKKPC